MLLVTLDPTVRAIDVPPLAREDGLIQLTWLGVIQFWAKPFKSKEEVMYFIKGRSYLAAIF